MDGPAQPVLKAGQRRFLLCLAARIVPESAGAPPQVTEPLLAAVDQELGRVRACSSSSSSCSCWRSAG